MRGGDPVLLDEAGDGDDLDLRVARLDLGRRGDAVETGHQRGPSRRRPGAGRVDLVERRDAVRRLADDLEVVVQRRGSRACRGGPSRGRRRSGPGSGPSTPRACPGRSRATARRPGARPRSRRRRRVAGAMAARDVRPPAADRWRISAAAEDRQAAQRPGCGARRLVEQHGRKGDPDDRLEQHQDPGPRAADRAGSRSGTGSTGWPRRTGR